MKYLLSILLLMAFPASAAQPTEKLLKTECYSKDTEEAAKCQPWSPISKIGDSIEVENYRCTVTGERNILCMNIGAVCVRHREQEGKQRNYFLGCMLDDWIKAHPGEKCPDKFDYDPVCSEFHIGGF